jgi:hypothetical protein
LDILKFIKTQRFTAVSLYGLMTREQRKFSEKLAEKMLSEYSTPVTSEQDSTQPGFVPPKLTNWGLKKNKEEEYNFIEPVIESKNDVDKRLV